MVRAYEILTKKEVFMERFSAETLRLLQEIEESTKDILREAEKELRRLSPQQRKELFGVEETPLFDDPLWDDLFPLGSEEENEEF
jgi:hypothetical protein